APAYLGPAGVDFEGLRWEILAFARAVGGRPPVWMKGMPLPQTRRGLVPSIFDPDPIPAVRELHQDIAGALNGLVKDHQFALPIRVERYRWDAKAGVLVPVMAPCVDFTEDTWVKSWVFGAVVQLVTRTVVRMRVCRATACRRLFLWD